MENNEFGTEKIGKLMMRFAIPAVISMIVNSLYNIVDQIFIGWGVGYLGNAATNVVFPFVILSMGVAFMIGDGAASYFSLKLGEGRMKAVQSSLGNALIMSSVAGVSFMILGLLFLQPIFQLLGATAAVMPYALSYGRIIMFGMPFACVGMALSAIIRADGSPNFTMVSMLTGAILNTILDPVFIFVFGWGVEGAALATVIGQFASFVLNIYYLKRFKTFKVTKEFLKPNGHTMKRIVALGTASFIGQFAATVVMTLVNNMLVHYGGLSVYGPEIPLAAVGIVLKVSQIMLGVVIGLAVGAQPILGYNYGARNYARVKETYKKTMVMSIAVMTVAFVVFQFAPHLLVGLFGTGEPLYNEFAVKCFRIFMAACILIGFNDITGIYFQAVGKSLQSTVVSLARQILFFVPILVVLPMFMGLEGILYSGPIADVISFLLTSFLMYREMKKLTALEQDKLQAAQGVLA